MEEKCEITISKNVVDSNFNALRGKLYSAIELLGIEEKREKAIKTIIGDVTHLIWANILEGKSLEKEGKSFGKKE